MSAVAVIGGASAILVVPMLLATVLAWARHLRGGEAAIDRTTEWTVVGSLLLLIFPAIAVLAHVYDSTGAWFAGVTTGAIVGFGVGAVGRVLLVFDAIDSEGALVVGAVGFAPVAVWLLSIAMIGIRDHEVPIALGLLSVLVLILAVLGMSAATIKDRNGARCFGSVLMIAMVGWLSAVAIELFRAA